MNSSNDDDSRAIVIWHYTVTDTPFDKCHYPTDKMKPRRNKDCTNIDIFLDFWITKSDLANLLGVARSTINVWENLAFWRIDHFRQSYPKKSDGTFDRESPISPYQAWVLGRIGRVMSQVRRSQRVKSYIQQNPQEFSKFRYQAISQQVNQRGA